MKKYIPQIPKWCLYLLGIVVSIKALHEPDTFWQLRTGQWILQHGQVPKQDVFSSSMQGKPWVNIKWGYEVIIAAIQKATSIECIFILQIIITSLIVFLLFKIIKQLGIDNYWAVLCSGIAMIAMIEFRINGRPESISWLMAIAFISILIQPLTIKNAMLLFVLQILWCNLHEAFGIGIVIAIIYNAALIFTKIFNKNTYTSKLFLLIPLLILATCINPYGIQLALKPLDIFNQIQTNKYTTELSSMMEADYWVLQAKLFWAIVLLGVVGIIKCKNKLSKLSALHINFYVAIVIAFTFLAALALRNIPFAAIVWMPIWAFIISTIVATYLPKPIVFIYASGLLFIIFYYSIASNKWYQNTGQYDVYGMQMLNASTPYGATNYLQAKQLDTNIFADYLLSSYLLYKMQPSYKTYIDLRDLDVFTDSFFNNYLQLVNRPDSFMQFLNTHHYNTVLLYTNSYPSLHARMYNDSIFACTYVDGVAAVYQRTDEFSKEDVFAPYHAEPIHPLATAINTIAYPLFAPASFDEYPYDLLAAQYYTNVFRFDLAEKRLQNVLQQDPNNAIALGLQTQISSLKNTKK
jgi:hypothetical protein